MCSVRPTLAFHKLTADGCTSLEEARGSMSLESSTKDLALKRANTGGLEDQMNYMELVAKGCEILACLFLGALGLIILYKISTDKIDLEWLISEDNGHAS